MSALNLLLFELVTFVLYDFFEDLGDHRHRALPFLHGDAGTAIQGDRSFPSLFPLDRGRESATGLTAARGPILSVSQRNGLAWMVLSHFPHLQNK
jgi:hypothetical protein